MISANFITAIQSTTAVKEKEKDILKELKNQADALNEMLDYVNRGDADLLNSFNQRITFNPLRAIMISTIKNLRTIGQHDKADFYMNEVAKYDIGLAKLQWTNIPGTVKIVSQLNYLN